MRILILLCLLASSVKAQVGAGSETATASGKTLVLGTAFSFSAGGSSSNFTPSGRVFASSVAYTNLNGTGTMTNLANISIPANCTTNNGDILYAEWAGRMASAAANTNQFQIVFGSTTILDTGLQIASNCAWRAECTLTRTGTTSQHANASFWWGPGGGVPFAFTNVNLELTETNGIATTLALKGGARAVGAHTNNYFAVFWR